MGKCVTEEIFEFLNCGYEVEDIATITGWTTNQVRLAKRIYDRETAVKPDPLKKTVLSKLAELKKMKQGLSVTNDKERLKYLIYSGQIAILESLDDEFRELSDEEYLQQCLEYGRGKM